MRRWVWASRWVWCIGLVVVGLAVAPVAAGGTVRSSAATSVGARTAAQVEPGPDYTPTGPLVADTGFRPIPDGFGFENYGLGVPFANGKFSPRTNLTPAAIRDLFGDGVCASEPSDTCTLTAPAQQWADAQNAAMEGHCYGFSVTSLELFKQILSPTEFGAARTSGIQLPDNEAIQSQIARNFVTQFLPSVRDAIISGAPNEVLDRLRQVLTPDASETYGLGFYNRERSSGHAVTPYAIEDRGDGTFAVLIYDNNYPGVTRAVIFDTNANTWAYQMSSEGNPAGLWEGDAQTQSIELDPTSPGRGVQPCPFCSKGAPTGSETASQPGVGPVAGGYSEVFLQGATAQHGNLLITDEQGRRYGFVDGKLVTEIPGVQAIVPKLGVAVWKKRPEPIYRIPTDADVSFTIDGSTLKKSDTTSVVLVGPGYAAAVRGIELRPGQTDTLKINADGKGLTYNTTTKQAPVFELGVEQVGSSHAFSVSKSTVAAGGAFNMQVDTESGQLNVNTVGGRPVGTYKLAIQRVTPDGAQKFTHRNIALASGATSTADYGDWQAARQPITVKSVSPSGTERTRELTNQAPNRRS